ncbi:nitrile hydratase accessory protein [Antarcticimicrobium sediminis]|uniref:Nitrile hydratase accessory protein n=1 Tax=Antarcticimicrobium sediminis TaxID=2546227 RepID=A0A4V2Z8F2_9RHOB|nr:nitrile hydratase accessory protein [Antarcticimicrobium sediminis]TDE40146.1 nitrile hydratase accessory protein [Antarcticimicrobium sediminis]
MSDQTTGATSPEPVFTQPWHGQVFALTVSLNEAGHFDWPEWTARFSQTLVRHGLEKQLDGGDDYFNAWLETLESLLVDLGQAAPQDVQRLRDAWEAAYLATPHGDPVHLPDGV